MGAAQNVKMQKWGLQFKAGQEESFFLKNTTKVRLEKGETKCIKVRVCDQQDGTSKLEDVDITYVEVRRYLEDFGGVNIQYLNQIVDQTCEYDVNVWVCDETVMYLPPPVMNLDPVHSSTIAKSWEKEYQDVHKKRKSRPRRSRDQTVAQGQHSKKEEGQKIMNIIYSQRVKRL